MGLNDTTRVEKKKVWTALVTNTSYLTGLLTLDHSLKRSGSKYPLVALYTDTLSSEGRAALAVRDIPTHRIPYLLPSEHKDYSNDTRFYDCWSKLACFSLTEYDRVVQLDSDMLVIQNIDELMDLPLDGASVEGRGRRVFAACHACVCNPMKKPHYPSDWVPSNCAYTGQHNAPERAQMHGPTPASGVSILNGGLLVINPSQCVYKDILCRLQDPVATSRYAFADQSLLSDLFSQRWVCLPYVYNALKPMRLPHIHGVVWRDERVKVIHYNLSPKPWHGEVDSLNNRQANDTLLGELDRWWRKANDERLESERVHGIVDDF